MKARHEYSASPPLFAAGRLCIFRRLPREMPMRFFRAVIALHLAALCGAAGAQYGTAPTLKAELQPGGDLSFASETKELGLLTNLANAVLVPSAKPEGRLPGLVILHTCGGISAHIRYWAEEALKERYAVLVLDSMRGLKADCGSPPQISNARLVKDALDGVAHLASLPFVDAKRISILGFSKGANTANWLGSSAVAEAVRPGTPPIAAAVSVYGLCALAPTRARPQGIVILQPETDRPLLVLMGGLDNETPPAACLEMLPRLAARGAPVRWHLYEGATHAWDSPEKNGFTKQAYNNQTVTYRYDKAATEDARKRIFEFLAKPPGS
jgi:dienelactone hydrolase